jgi:hypothetical protein
VTNILTKTLLTSTILLSSTLLLTSCTTTVISQGDRVGTVTKLSHKLNTCGTWSWEGELAMQAGTLAGGQGITEGGQSAVGAWAFSLGSQVSSETVRQFRDAMNTGHIVRVGYEQYRFGPCDLATEYKALYAADLQVRVDPQIK